MKLRTFILRSVIEYTGTLESAAKLAGCSISSMSKYARGEREIPMSTFWALMVNADDLATPCPTRSLINQDKETCEARVAAMMGERNGVLDAECIEAMASVIELHKAHRA